MGILLCVDKDSEEVHYAKAGLSNAVFVSRYLVALHSDEQLKAFLQREQEILSRMQTKGDSKERIDVLQSRYRQNLGLEAIRREV